uniref:hypothetical protein n=1 Tax=Sphingomonas bacterium TaxID=1895847 RepID=UPI00261B5305|nr:hypothetical protein [Sphingomonas bacterium]
MRARLTERAGDWPWSSMRALVGGGDDDDGITATHPVASRYPAFAELLTAGEDEEISQRHCWRPRRAPI